MRFGVAFCVLLGSFGAFADEPVKLLRGYVQLDYIWATNGEQFVSTGLKASPKENYRIALDRKVIPLVTNAADGVILTGKLPERTHSFRVVRIDTKIEKKDKTVTTNFVDKVLAEYVPALTDKGVAVFYDTVSKRDYGTAVKGAAFKPGYPDWQFVVDDVQGDWWMDGGEPICPPVVIRDKTTDKELEQKDFKVVYSNNVNCGKAYVFVTGAGSVHTGMVTKNFTLQTTFAVAPKDPALAPLGGSFSLWGVSDEKTRGVEWSITTNVYADCKAMDFTFRVSCPRENRTPKFKALNAADFTLPFAADAEIAVWNGVGETWVGKEDAPSNFSFTATALKPGETQAFAAKDGYSSSFAFPYFRVYDAKSGKGWTVALGYQGEWKISFARTAKGVRVLGGLKNVDFYLSRSETAILPTVTLMAFEDLDGAVNGWRAFFRKHVLPRDRRTGGLIRPQLALDPHEKGELYTESTADRLVEIVKGVREKGLHFDTLWVDAGWYTPQDYKKQTEAPLWWETVGAFVPDPKRFPQGFKPVADELAKDDAQLLLWYETERVHRLSPNVEEVKRYCYSLVTNNCYRYNLASSDTRKYLVETFGKSLVDNGVGIFREDCNVSPELWWKVGEDKDRAGLRENFYVQGRRAFWNEMRKRFPNMLFDSVAAGGRRLDLSTLSFPSVPLWYSDVAGDVADMPALQRCQHLLNQWFVYRRDVGAHAVKPGAKRDWARTVTCLAPMQTVFAKNFLDNDAAEDAKAVEIWRQVARLMIDGDYYLLTPEAFGEDKWWACEFNEPQSGRGFVQVVRNAKAADAKVALKLKGLMADAAYVATDLLTGQKLALAADGTLEVELAANAGAIVAFRAVASEKAVPTLSSESYVSDGLYAQWDGLENAGRGKHDEKAETWVNLVSVHHSLKRTNKKNRPFGLNGFRFIREEESMVFYGGDFGSWHRDMGPEWTFEAFVTPGAGWRNNHPGILGYHANECTGVVMGQCGESNRRWMYWFGLSRNARDGVGFEIPADRFATGKPLYLALSCDAKEFTLWTNGVKAVSKKLPDGLSSVLTAPTFYIGRTYPENNRTFDGTIHAVRVYGRALPPEAIAENASVDRQRFTGWHFESANAKVTLEGEKDYVVRAMPLGVPSAPTGTVARVTMRWYGSKQVGVEMPYLEPAVEPYAVTNFAEGVAWRCEGGKTVYVDQNERTLEFTFKPTAYKVTSLKPKNGEIVPAEGWAPVDGVYTVTAKPAPGASFYRWIKGVDADTLMKPTATVHAKGPVSVAVEFESEEISDADFGE